MNQKIFGDYVLTGVPNAFNSKTSWWLSKKGFMRAMYCFSTFGSEKQVMEELDYQLSAIDSYIACFAKTYEEE